MRYVLWKSLGAMTGKSTLTEIPAGEIVEGPARIPGKGIVNVGWAGKQLTVLAKDLFDSGTLVTGEAE